MNDIHSERSSAESVDERVESTEEEGALAAGQSSGVRRRRIPRTRASERVRTRIQANRAAIAMMLDSEVIKCSLNGVSILRIGFSLGSGKEICPPCVCWTYLITTS